MTDRELAARLRQVLAAAKYRSGARAVLIPNVLLDEIAAMAAPILRDLVREAVRAELGEAA